MRRTFTSYDRKFVVSTMETAGGEVGHVLQMADDGSSTLVGTMRTSSDPNDGWHTQSQPWRSWVTPLKAAKHLVGRHDARVHDVEYAHEQALQHDTYLAELARERAEREARIQAIKDEEANRRATKPMLTLLTHAGGDGYCTQAGDPRQVALYYDPETGKESGVVELYVRRDWRNDNAPRTMEVSWSSWGGTSPALALEYGLAIAYAAEVAMAWNAKQVEAAAAATTTTEEVAQ